jgi:endonuclease/exonuclease/phosphatase family metal-dependent hydrolase
MLETLGGATAELVLMGDLNAPPTAPELAPLLGRLRDAWTSRRDPGFTYPATAPVRRIDYILTTSDVQATRVRVIATEASDHRPVIADLSIR